MDTSLNPYHRTDGKRVVVPSVVAVMDILGFTQMCINAHRDGQENEFLGKLYTALEKGRSNLDHEKFLRDMEKPSSWCKDSYAIKAFTDNIVVGWPIHDDAEGELASAFSAIAWFQLEMVNAGFFVRGAISIGNVYIDEIAVFGGGLIDAYEGESMRARDPRIILTGSSMAAVEKHLSYYGYGAHAPQNRDLLRDADGQFFVNYLDDTVLIAPDEAGPGFEMLETHKERIIERLAEHKSNPVIWNKYAWVARYHNYFCEINSEYFGDDYKIDVTEFEMSPSLLIDPYGSL